jgi:hypothetical protein
LHHSASLVGILLKYLPIHLKYHAFPLVSFDFYFLAVKYVDIVHGATPHKATAKTRNRDSSAAAMSQNWCAGLHRKKTEDKHGLRNSVQINDRNELEKNSGWL